MRTRRLSEEKSLRSAQVNHGAERKKVAAGFFFENFTASRIGLTALSVSPVTRPYTRSSIRDASTSNCRNGTQNAIQAPIGRSSRREERGAIVVTNNEHRTYGSNCGRHVPCIGGGATSAVLCYAGAGTRCQTRHRFCPAQLIFWVERHEGDAGR